MGNAVYPSNLPGLTFNVVRSPRFKTEIKSTPSGREFRFAQMAYANYDYTLEYEFLRDSASYPELRTLLGFFLARRGSFDSFLFNDPDDCAVTAQQFGVGDGSTKQFQLLRTLGGNVDPVYDLNGVPSLYVNGAGAVGYSINSTAGVTFTNAPAAGAVLTWTGAYYWRCRFMDDSTEFKKFMYQLWEAKQVQFTTVKP